MASAKDYSAFVPFDLYDFFGYLFPGTIFAASVTFFIWHIDPDPFNKLWPHCAQSVSPADVPFLLGLAIVVVSIIALYTLGHFVATLSHILIDRVLVDGIEGYPFAFLLNITPKARPYSEATYKYLFTAYNLLLLIPAFGSDMHQLRPYLLALLIVVAFLILQRVAIMVVHMIPHGRDFARRMGNIWVFKMFLYPDKYLVNPLIEFLRKLLGMDRRFPDAFIDQYKATFRKTFDQLNPDAIGSENYWLSAFHALAANGTYRRMLDTWLQLYGFARNASAAFYLSASLILTYLYFNPQDYDSFMRLYVLAMLALAAGLGIRYWILYSHYYSKGIFRAFIDSSTH